MNQDELDAAFKKHFAKRGKRERGMIARRLAQRWSYVVSTEGRLQWPDRLRQ
jgi:hypothetical protein